MIRDVVLTIRGQQTYGDAEPEVIELVTEGTMAYRDGGWDISYQESALTGLEGVTTTFRVEPAKVILRRTGALQSEMVFQEGIPHDSLYQMSFGTMMMTVKGLKQKGEATIKVATARAEVIRFAFWVRIFRRR